VFLTGKVVHLDPFFQKNGSDVGLDGGILGEYGSNVGDR
jgi:hypothetical protein